jgi:hypothetical protein
MKFSEKFSDDEIQNLKLSLMRVFNIIADADSKIDKNEVKSLEVFSANAGKLNYDCVTEIFSDLPAPGVLEEQRQLSGLGDREGLRYISALLERKAGHETAVEFKKTLMSFGYFVADSSGSLFEHNVNDDENSALHLIAKDLDISLRDLINSNQVHKIIEKINS